MSDLISPRTRHLLVIFYGLAAVVFTSVIIGGLQRLEPDPLQVVAFHKPATVTQQPGDLVVFWREVCASKAVIVHTHREFVNLATGKKYTLPSVSYVSSSTGNCYETRFETPLPDDIPPGEYEYRPALTYEVNPSKTISKAAPVVRVVVE